MRTGYLGVIFLLLLILITTSYRTDVQSGKYLNFYKAELELFEKEQIELLNLIKSSATINVKEIKSKINKSRYFLKRIDFWLRYLEPISYKKINGPLPIEWETEVFEKFERPYKREGAGLSLAYQYLEEEEIKKDSLMTLIQKSIEASSVYEADSISNQLNFAGNFFLCNRLFLLNLSTIYTTGFECPEKENIIAEMKLMLKSVNGIYNVYNKSFEETKLSKAYLEKFYALISFTESQSNTIEKFDYYRFIREFVNPLFSMNQEFIREYKIESRSYMDFSLNKNATSIFSKTLYIGQNTKGIYSRISDKKVLEEIRAVGKLLFYDPILSGNNMRSCASCHKPTEYFTDTLISSPLHFSGESRLFRNTPTLINTPYNHLIMLDGKHFSLQNQVKDVVTNKDEMNCEEKEVVKKVLSCKKYKDVFKNLLKHTPQEDEISFDHITSAITQYYSSFSSYYSPFDLAMNNKHELNEDIIQGFNLFMGKAQCATCHFVPQFNGVKPPYISTEFEVLGIPSDTLFKQLNADQGRFNINPSAETKRAFRTGTVRNSAKTKPYMHNGVFNTLDEVINFYNNGGGSGKGLITDNQTLSSDSLHLSPKEIQSLKFFISALNEDIPFERSPEALPYSRIKALNTRKIGGLY